MRVLVVAPHSDDETLGAGGTLLKMKEQGYTIAWLNVTVPKQEFGYTKEFCEQRKEQIQKVIEEFRFDEFYNLEFEPAGLDAINKKIFVEKVSEIFNQYKPEIIFVPYANDVHSDHRVVSDVIYSCTKAFRYPFIKLILEMEILSETDYAKPELGFVPNLFVNIENYIDKKIQIMEIYQSEVMECPFPRSIENMRSLATVRGCSSGYRYAEGFKIVKANWE